MMTIMEVVVTQQLWAGIDAGKSQHHCVVIDGWQCQLDLAPL
jgi:hypothetical protein